MQESTSHFDLHPEETRRRFLSKGSLALLCAPLNWLVGFVPNRPETHLRAQSPQLRRTGKLSLSIQHISDRLEIQDLLTRYCYAVDDRAWDTYRQLFTPDAVIDDAVTGGIKSGVEEHIAYMRKALSKILISQHAISTILVQLNGDGAHVRAHCSCPMVVDLGESKTHVFFQGLWYRNTLVRTRDGWKIAHLVEEGYWTYNMPPHFTF
jgi:ketosteroid isomerase-like protein